MTDNEFHTEAERLIEEFDSGSIDYEEFDVAYEALLEQCIYNAA